MSMVSPELPGVPRIALNYFDTNFPHATNEEILGDKTIEATKTIIRKEYPYLLGSLPYNIIVKGLTFASIPDNYRHKVTLTLKNPSYETSLSYNASLPEITGTRITLSFTPATSEDESLSTLYGGLLSVPSYLANVKPVLKINGMVGATGNAIGLGQTQTLQIALQVPNIGQDIASHKIVTGDYSAITIFVYKASSDLVADNMETLISNVGSADIDALLGQMLFNIGVSYFHHLIFEEELYAKNFQMAIVKGFSEALVTNLVAIETLWGVPYKTTEAGIVVDVAKNSYSPVPLDGSKNRKRDFMIISGLGSSAWEDKMLQSFLDIPSVSAATLLRLANRQGIPIFTIDKTNINTLLPQLEVSAEVITNIKNATNARKKVFISKTNVQYYDWTGVGYIIIDPDTGAGAYMISGGLAGGGTSRPPSVSLRNTSEYLRDGSALKTIFTRMAVVLLALYYLDTPYVWGGETPECGFDCSGFVHYLFTTIYGETILPSRNTTGGTARGQHDYLVSKGWIHPYEERLSGDILWRSTYDHTGIYYGIEALTTPQFIREDSVIHASGKPCTDQNDPNGWLPSETLPPQCSAVAYTNVRICGAFQRVVITSVNNAYFTNNQGIASDVGRPIP